MISEPKCYSRKCKHYQGVKRLGTEEITETNYCPAFPDGIPNEIAYGNNKHLSPFAGQVGDTIFEKK